MHGGDILAAGRHAVLSHFQKRRPLTADPTDSLSAANHSTDLLSVESTRIDLLSMQSNHRLIVDAIEPERVKGLEPSTSTMATWCSTN